MSDAFDNVYEKLNKIGEGGICDVWRVRNRGTQDIFCFKQLKSHTPENVEAIKTEYEFLKFYKHPGIVEAHSLVKEPENYGIILDYLPGETLDGKCGGYNTDNVLQIIFEILEIANFVHHCEYIYNDFKPQNFIFDRNNNLKLIDFNLIKDLTEPESLKSGTLGYLAPEIITGNAGSILSDIYSLGATLYELVSGRMPFEAVDEGSLIRQVTETRPRSLGSGNKALDSAIMMMLEPDTDKRPSNIFKVCRLLGLEKDLARKVRERREFYLNAGPWPHVADLLGLLRDRDNTDNVAIARSLNNFANDRFFRDCVTYADRYYDQVYAHDNESSFSKDDGGLILDSENFTSPSNSKTAIKNREKNRTLNLINSGANYNDDIKYLLENYPDTGKNRSQIILFTYSPDISSSDEKTTIYSPENEGKRNDIYISHYLKTFSLADDNMSRLRRLGGGDPEIIYHYLDYLISHNSMDYCEDGWYAEGYIDESRVPPELLISIKRIMQELPDDQIDILRWLAAYNFPIEIELLSQLMNLEISALGLNIGKLLRSGFLDLVGSKISISGRGKSLAIYELIEKNRKRSLHNKIIHILESKAADNFEALAYHTYASDKYEKALGYNLEAARHWYGKFDFKKARGYIERAESAFEKIGHKDEYDGIAINTYILGGDIAKALAENNIAESQYLTAVGLANHSGIKELLATAYKNLGDLYRLRQQPQQAIETSTRALKLYESLSDLPHQAACFNNLGLAFWTGGEYGQALRHFENALKINIRLEDLSEQCKLYNNIAIIYDTSGRKDEALAQFHKALDCAEAVENPQLEVKCLDNIGYFHLSSGNPTRALDYFLRSYNLAMKIGYDEGQLNVISNIAQAYHKTGEFIKSAEANQKALDIAVKLGHEKFQAQAAYLLARDCLALGNYRTAESMLDNAAEVGMKLSNPEMLNDIKQAQIDLALASGDLAKAHASINEIESSKNLTNNQLARHYWQILRLTAAKNNRVSIEDVDNLIERIRDTGLKEFHLAGVVEKARFLLLSGQLGQARQSLDMQADSVVEDVIIGFEYRLALAELHAAERAFDNALDLVKDIEERANKSGCLPILFRALLLEAQVLETCGKGAVAAAVFGHLAEVQQILVESLPPGANKLSLKNLEIYKNFDELADKMKDRIGGGR
jgi:serine/threonine protein kinase/tetratricopeptide (TPR) repeat protein